MKLIVGLGNVGAEYAKTRHNTGWQALERLALKHSISISRKHIAGRRLVALYQDFKFGNVLVRLVLPQTMMNLSGEAFLKTDEWGLDQSDVLIVYDDINLPVGSLRIRESGGDGGHHGLASCIQALGSEEIPRLRIGIGPEAMPYDLTEFVLMPFEDKERVIVDEALARAVLACELWAKEGIQAAMNKINPRERK
jgi:peptidyl-tRNA hydrolase, PTH1 family